MDKTYWNAIRGAMEWAMAGENHSVAVEFKPNNMVPLDRDTKISIWCYDSSNMTGIYIRMDWFNPNNPVKSINEALRRMVEEKELEQLRKLQEKYKSKLQGVSI